MLRRTVTEGYLTKTSVGPLTEAPDQELSEEDVEEAWSGEGDGPKIDPNVGKQVPNLEVWVRRIKSDVKMNDDTHALESFSALTLILQRMLTSFGWGDEARPLGALSKKLKKAAKDQGLGEQ